MTTDSRATPEDEGRTPARSRLTWWLVLVALWTVSLAGVWSMLDTSWIPHDEGTLAQAAERVLLGELPHADFDEVYTGGLDWLNAAAFRAFGVNLKSMRIALFLVFALWVPVVFWIATRFTSPLCAAPIAALAVAWSLPAYRAPMPSWYTLFFATFGTAALLRWLDTRSRWWIAIAGACAGLGILAKVTGIHFAAAALLFLAWCEPGLTRLSPRTAASRAYPLVVTALLAAFVAGLVVQIRPVAAQFGWFGEVEQFVLPGLVVAALTAHRCWRGSRAPASVRFRALASLVLPFVLGMAVPLLVFALPYVARGSLQLLFEGLIVLPSRRLELRTTVFPPLPLWKGWLLLPFVAIALLPRPSGRLWPKVALAAAAVALAGATWLVPRSREFYWLVGGAMLHVFPLLACFGAWLLWSRPANEALAARVVAVLAVTALVSLVQFPFTVPLYFCYVAPLVALSVLATLSLTEGGVRGRPGIVLLAGFVIAVTLVVEEGFAVEEHPPPAAHIGNERVGLRVPLPHVPGYERVVQLVRLHARGPWVWAGPDAPEVAFLAGLRNPTRTIFDCFDRDFGDDPAVRAERLLKVLEARGVNVVAVNLHPGFSGPLHARILEALHSRYPMHAEAGKFIVAWRE